MGSALKSLIKPLINRPSLKSGDQGRQPASEKALGTPIKEPLGTPFYRPNLAKTWPTPAIVRIPINSATQSGHTGHHRSVATLVV